MSRLGNLFRKSTALISAVSLTTAGLPIGTQTARAQNVLPQGGSVAAGSATISQPSVSVLSINQSSQRAIINWNSFSVGQPNSVNFYQPNSSAAVLNRVTGSTLSTIAGQLNANGQIYLVNPNGIAITPSGAVNVGGGFVASTLDVGNSDFMTGNLNFRGNGASAGVSNQGSLKTAPGGFVGLLGGTVSNRGTISVPLGKVGLGSGEKITLDLNGDGFMQVAVPTNAVASNGRSLIEVAGSIRATGGKIEISAATVAQAIRDAVNVSGSLSANSIVGRDGSINLGGGPGGNVKISGTLRASGSVSAGKILTTGANVELSGAKITTQSLQGKGGEIIITAANNVAVSGSTLNASGGTGGGGVRIGGDFHGLGTIGTAATTIIDENSTIKTDAILSGPGGTVVLWSGTLTTFGGLISAKGGAQAGNGGTVEVSSKGKLAYRGVTDLSAVKGQTGTLLLDPDDFPIDAAAASAIVTTLATANVTVLTTAGGVGGSGDITINSPINWATANSFTASAYRHIFVNANVTNTGGAAVNLRADNSATGIGTVSFGGGSISTTGAVSIFYNPSSYATPTNYDGNVIGTTPTAYMLVNDVNQLQAVNTNLAGTYALGGNIDATITSTWNGSLGFEPLGNPGTQFTGIFNGQNHTIGNLFINRPGSNYVALFGYLGTVGTIQKVDLIGGSVTGNAWVGGLIGESLGAVTQSSSGATIIGADRVGGLIGVMLPGSSLSQSYATGEVIGGTWTGGLVGVNAAGVTATGTITQSYATGNVSGTEFVGGLVGYNFISNVTQSYAIGNVTGSNPSGAQSIGGLVGDNFQSIVTTSYATGNVSGQRDVGGLVGRNRDSSQVIQSYATGAVSAAINYNPGGLVGYNDPTSSISYSYATGPVTLVGTAQWGGGLVGWNNGTIIQSYATGLVSGPPVQYVGGLVGNSGTGTVIQSYWDTTTTGQALAAGVGTGNPQPADAYALQSSNPAGADYAYKTAAYVGWNFGTGPTGPANDCTGACWVIVDSKGTFNNVGGTGATRPFLLSEYSTTIKNSHELQLASLDLGASYTLAKDINLGPALAADINGNYPGMWSSAGFVPISNATGFPLPAGTPFTGVFDGQGFTISNLTIDRPAVSGIGDYTGLFGFNRGTVKNVNLTGANITGGDFAVGGLVGYNGFDSLVQNVTIAGTVNASPTGGIDVGYAGGLTGLNRGAITQSMADVAVSGYNYVGGLVGSNHNIIALSSASGTVSGNDSIGGLSGYNWNGAGGIGSISQSSASGAVSGIVNVGGLLGYNDNGTVALSNASGGVSGPNTIGGLVGQNAAGGNITQSFASGPVTGTGIAQVVGGLVGRNLGTIQNTSYATGDVSGTIYVGGLVGVNQSAILNADASGITTGSTNVGGLVGYNLGSISQSNPTSAVTGAPGSVSVGGLAGYNAGTIQNSSHSIGTVSGGADVGGLVGLNDGAGSITLSNASGNVTGTGNHVAGLVGTNYGLVTQSNYTNGTVTGDLAVGGLVGWNPGSVTLSFVDATATVTGNGYMGGLVGYNGFNSPDIVGTVSESYSMATVTGSASAKYVGGLVGYNQRGNITQSYASGSVAGQDAVGGLVGWNDVAGSVTLSYASGSVTGTSLGASPPDGGVGGLVGRNSGSVSQSYAMTGIVTGFDDVGGLVGQNNAGASVMRSYASNTVIGLDNHIGGLVGLNSGLVALSYASSTVTGNLAVGGLVGWNRGSITQSYAEGPVSGNGYLGGLVGYNGHDAIASVADSYATGSVSGTPGSNFVGGLIGNNNFGSTVMRTYAAGAVSGTNDVGGLVGFNDFGSSVTMSYWDTQTTGTSFGVGTSGGVFTALGLTTAQAQNLGTFQSTYTGWNFQTIWSPPNQVGQSGYAVAHYPKLYSVNNDAVWVQANDATRVYGDPNPAFTANYYGLNSGDTLVTPVSLTTPATPASNVGNYLIEASPLSVTGTSGTDYRVIYTGTLAVTQALLTFTATAASRDYGDPNPLLSGAITGFKNDQLAGDFGGATWTTTALPTSNVGSYPITGGLVNPAPNYSFAQAAGNATALTVNQRPITVTPHPGQFKVYGDGDPALTYTTTSLGSGAAVNGVLARDPDENVGPYAITQGTVTNGATNPNYLITFTSGVSFAINQRPITVTPHPGQFKVYGDGDPALTFTTTSLGSGVAVNGVLARDPDENVGPYAITQGTVTNGATNPNYLITFTSGVSFAINQRPITVTPHPGQFKVYGDGDPALTFTTTSLGSGAAVNGVLARDPDENVGPYAITQGTVTNGATNPNYLITFTSGVSFAINQRPITVTPHPGQFKVYGDGDPALTFTTTSLGSGVAVNGVLARDPGENVGPYAITQGTVTNGGNPNYLITFTSGVNFAINQRPITVTADPKSKGYDNNPGTDPALTYVIGSMGLANGDVALNGALTRVPGQNVGVYSITQGTVTSVNNPNYNITYAGANFTITQYELTYSVANVTYTFGMLPAPGAVTLTGVVPGDTVTPIVGVFNSSNVLITLSTSTPVGTYSELVIGLSGPSAANYSIASAGNTNGILTIQDAGNVQASVIANTLANNSANSQGSNPDGNQNCSSGGIGEQFKKTGTAVIFSGNGVGCGTP